MNNQSAEFEFTGTLQFFVRHGVASPGRETSCCTVDLTGAEKMKYGPLVSCSCVMKEDNILLQFSSSGNLPAGIIKGLLYTDGKITAKYELPDTSVYTVVIAHFLSGSHGYTLRGSWPWGINFFYFEANLVVEE